MDNHPVKYVSWHDAIAYCEWLNSKLEGSEFRKVRLSTEAEWEKATRGAVDTIYPWGNSADTNKMNFFDTGIRNTSTVGSFPGSNNSYGLLDMNGNVWEWVEDVWHNNYEGAPNDGSAWLDKSNGGSERVLRGGGWVYGGRDARSASRDRDDPGHRFNYYGFRLAQGQNKCR